ncbi:hypothetical protein OUZ56_005666 [Daphnia magna]|uniref:Uncharacterized protein n=1 Tax=Daphnia magna TaxID=35525 RepID=A0ABQ9YTE9_9CRUS|nr:hypothetical protein OUZ56_005666 [Daphnia magna]
MYIEKYLISFNDYLLNQKVYFPTWMGKSSQHTECKFKALAKNRYILIISVHFCKIMAYKSTFWSTKPICHLSRDGIRGDGDIGQGWVLRFKTSNRLSRAKTKPTIYRFIAFHVLNPINHNNSSPHLESNTDLQHHIHKCFTYAIDNDVNIHRQLEHKLNCFGLQEIGQKKNVSSSELLSINITKSYNRYKNLQQTLESPQNLAYST